MCVAWLVHSLLIVDFMLNATNNVEHLSVATLPAFVFNTGPTATGKSSVALALCKDLGGEIVSCDSVQVYREVVIGCNKPSAEEMREVRHHLVDVAALDETFTAGNTATSTGGRNGAVSSSQWRDCTSHL